MPGANVRRWGTGSPSPTPPAFRAQNPTRSDIAAWRASPHLGPVLPGPEAGRLSGGIEGNAWHDLRGLPRCRPHRVVGDRPFERRGRHAAGPRGSRSGRDRRPARCKPPPHRPHGRLVEEILVRGSRLHLVSRQRLRLGRCLLRHRGRPLGGRRFRRCLGLDRRRLRRRFRFRRQQIRLRRRGGLRRFAGTRLRARSLAWFLARCLARLFLRGAAIGPFTGFWKFVGAGLPRLLVRARHSRLRRERRRRGPHVRDRHHALPRPASPLRAVEAKLLRTNRAIRMALAVAAARVMSMATAHAAVRVTAGATSARRHDRGIDHRLTGPRFGGCRPAGSGGDHQASSRENRGAGESFGSESAFHHYVPRFRDAVGTVGATGTVHPTGSIVRPWPRPLGRMAALFGTFLQNW